MIQYSNEGKDYWRKYMKKIIALLLTVLIMLCLVGCSKTCGGCEGKGSVKCTHCVDGKTPCTNCNGEKHLDCEKCGGKGYITSNEKCAACKDSKRPGYTYRSADAFRDWYNGTMKDANDSKYWKECSTCHGSGYKTETCPSCQGSGEGADCTVCNASGRIVCPYCNGSQTVTCSACGGTGKVKQ